MEDLLKLNYLYKLKNVERYGSVKNRSESTAEHVYSSMILAEYMLKKIKTNLNENKVIKMILIHDLVELESGDTFILDEENVKTQEKREKEGFQILLTKIPQILKEEYRIIWGEYKENISSEAKFVHAIDSLDPIIQSFDKIEDWKKYNFTEKNLRDKKEKYFKDFPEFVQIFEEAISYFNKNNYFS